MSRVTKYGYANDPDLPPWFYERESEEDFDYVPEEDLEREEENEDENN